MEISWILILQQILEVVIIPLLGILTTVLIKYINSKSKEAASKTDNLLQQKYIYMLNDTITSCVLATSQTYVDTLKKEGKFDTEAQKKAFKMTYESVMNILTDDAKSYLYEIYGDLESYITAEIEAEVNNNKK